MAGHSHWAGIKHKKAIVDAKRGKLWSKLSKAIMVAARLGGGDIETNVRLRTAIADAKAVSMPKDNIERALKKGTGELDDGMVEEVVYEGYGPFGVAVMCEALTDNRNRTAPELRKIFEVHGGKLGETNCVAYMFERKGILLIDEGKADEETLMETALEAGAEDIRSSNQQFEVTCAVDALADLREALEQARIEVMSQQVTQLPNNTVSLDAAQARKIIRFLEALDDHDDLQVVSANMHLSEEVTSQLENE